MLLFGVIGSRRGENSSQPPQLRHERAAWRPLASILSVVFSKFCAYRFRHGAGRQQHDSMVCAGATSIVEAARNDALVPLAGHVLAVRGV